jgi:predicted small integral membrane protein
MIIEHCIFLLLCISISNSLSFFWICLFTLFLPIYKDTMYISLLGAAYIFLSVLSFNSVDADGVVMAYLKKLKHRVSFTKCLL